MMGRWGFGLRIGNVSDEEFCLLVDLARRYASGIRTNQRQNMVFQWVRNEALYSLYQGLKAHRFADPGANELSDVVSCPGTESCSLGITVSMSIGAHLWDSVRELKKEPGLTGQRHPYQHLRLPGRLWPAPCGPDRLPGGGLEEPQWPDPVYEVYLRGSQVHPVRYGTRLKIRVPSKRIDEAIQAIIDHYVANRQEEEQFNAFVDRVTPTSFEEVLQPISEVPELSRDTINYYIDWSHTTLYKVERGEGECAI